MTWSLFPPQGGGLGRGVDLRSMKNPLSKLQLFAISSKTISLSPLERAVQNSRSDTPVRDAETSSE
ncbi:MAG TPA: hypothetical protein DCS44_07735 [Cyanobacteria bacterium UBA10660]|nr:MAG TPA: hypothetical protein CPT83_02490 [Candidatus Gastranaerophilales bacterium HUM_1]HAS94487.1 hypothetical protein [Cyanobacteria bacterium UBA10660]